MVAVEIDRSDWERSGPSCSGWEPIARSRRRFAEPVVVVVGTEHCDRSRRWNTGRHFVLEFEFGSGGRAFGNYLGSDTEVGSGTDSVVGLLG